MTKAARNSEILRRCWRHEEDSGMSEKSLHVRRLGPCLQLTGRVSGTQRTPAE